ncbi:MAG: hypothetical protein JXA89_13700 [Anaerolineae bacterium]|nr:hypothetical protein [Anaerolineae bacterium]
MSENHRAGQYERKVTPIERSLSLSPFAIVTMVARIKGNVSERMLTNAVSQVRQRHPHLRVRIKQDSDHDLWFTSEGAGDIPIEIVPRQAAAQESSTRKPEDHWIQVFHEACRIPFDFDARPAIRFILVQSPTESELIILCHHIICDGLSLAYLARDLMVHLGDPTRKVELLPDPVPVGRNNIPEDVSLNGLVRFLINRINGKWEQDRIVFDQEDYESIHEAYWLSSQHRMFSIELSEAQTSALVDRCQKEQVTVNSALTAAFVGAQYRVQGDKPYHSSVGVAVSLRDRLPRPAGEAMGFYAGIVTPKCKYDGKTSFWENARRFHRKIQPLYTNKNMFQDPLTWCHLEPSILEALNFKRLGGLVPPHSPRYEKLSAFGKRDDVILALLKREKMDALDRVIMGTAVTNLTRMDFPRTYGTLELDRLIMNPGGAFPLSNVNLVLGAVTCAGKLSLVLEYAEQTVDTRTMEAIKAQAMAFLLER